MCWLGQRQRCSLSGRTEKRDVILWTKGFQLQKIFQNCGNETTSRQGTWNCFEPGVLNSWFSKSCLVSFKGTPLSYVDLHFLRQRLLLKAERVECTTGFQRREMRHGRKEPMALLSWLGVLLWEASHTVLCDSPCSCHFWTRQFTLCSRKLARNKSSSASSTTSLFHLYPAPIKEIPAICRIRKEFPISFCLCHNFCRQRRQRMVRLFWSFLFKFRQILDVQVSQLHDQEQKQNTKENLTTEILIKTDICSGGWLTGSQQRQKHWEFHCNPGISSNAWQGKSLHNNVPSNGDWQIFWSESIEFVFCVCRSLNAELWILMGNEQLDWNQLWNSDFLRQFQKAFLHFIVPAETWKVSPESALFATHFSLFDICNAF